MQWRAEAVGCPGPTRFLDALENILYSSRKISDDHFLVVHLIFSLIRISCQISREFAPWMPPTSAASCPDNDIFYFFFGHIPTFFKENWSLWCPQGGCPGPSHRPHPLCTPLFVCYDYYAINSRAKIIEALAVAETWRALARAVTKTPKHHHITSVLKSLHWLKIPQLIHYKIASLTYNTLQTSQPSYIRQLLTIQPPGSTRSSSYLSLSRPPVSSSLKFCNRSFAYAAPTLWNGLPKDLRQFSHPPNRALKFTYILRSHSPLLLSIHDWKQNSLRYPIPVLLLHHDTSAIVTHDG